MSSEADWAQQKAPSTLALELTELSLSNSKASGSDESLQANKNQPSRTRRDLESKADSSLAPATRHSCHLPRQHGSGVIPRARFKTVKMTFVIVAAFILCWSPFCIINMLFVFDAVKKDTSLTIALPTLTQSLAHLNSAVNPIIFWLFTGRRRSANKRKKVKQVQNNLAIIGNSSPQLPNV